jgi:UDP-glucose 4-epimerase/UDP-glucuronate decarboxylase
VAERALVTGGAGFVGLHLCRALLRDGWEVVVVDDLSRSGRDTPLVDLLGHVRLIEHDLSEPLSDVAGLGTDYRAVYHLAAMVGVARVAAEPARVLRTNLQGTANVAEWCARVGPETLLFSSTSEIGDGAVQVGLVDLPAPETAPAVFAAPLLPRTAYAVSKLAGELLVTHTCHPAGIRVRIARFHNVYGPRMGHHHVIPELIGRITAGQDPLEVFGAEQRRAFCHVDDAVRAVRSLVDHPTAEVVLANVGNDTEETVIGELAGMLLDRLGVAVPVAPLPPPAGSPARRLPDLGVLRRLTGYEPTVPLARGLDDCVSWHLGQLAPRGVG